MSSPEAGAGPKRKIGIDEQPLSPRKAAKLTEFADYDSDQEPPEFDVEDTLKWRGDPADTHSDWTIKIVHEGSEEPKTDTYHVHKYVLSYGARKSEYFNKLFQDAPGRFPEAADATSIIHLHPLAASVFPALLDFVYKPGSALDIETKTATALHHLGQYFGMKRLRWDAKQFVQKDIIAKQVPPFTLASTHHQGYSDKLAGYYEHAMIFHDEKVLDEVAKTVACNVLPRRFGFPLIRKSHVLVKIFDPTMWWKVLQQMDTTNEQNSKTMSDIIAENLAGNAESVDIDTFVKLTASDKLPFVSYEAALKLMEVGDTIFDNQENETIKEQYQDLEERCANALASQWAALEEATQLDLQKRKPEFLAKVLRKSIKAAQIVKRNLIDSISQMKVKNNDLVTSKRKVQVQLKRFSLSLTPQGNDKFGTPYAYIKYCNKSRCYMHDGKKVYIYTGD